MDAHIEKMTRLAYEALTNSYSPYSNYQVGCCLYTDDGQYYAGCNVENASYGLVLCGEASAIGTMISTGSKYIKDVVIVNHLDTACFPCGACRQRILEHALNQDANIYLCNHDEILEQYTLKELLPHTFTVDTMEKNK